MRDICESKYGEICNTIIKLKSTYIDLVDMGMSEVEIIELLRGIANEE